MAEELNNNPARRTERIGKYEILGHVATGGMGVVYKARDTDLDRLVALKILPPDLAKNQTTLIRFKREAAAAAQLRHENIVSIFDIGESRGTHYIAFEFIEGTDLQDYINRQCKLDPKDARLIMMQATRALVHAHEQRVVHRDIKPSNFLLTYKEGKLLVKLTDFGLAIRQEDEAEFRLTKDRSTVGTVDYMSPEQATDSRSVDIRSDIYSLGCTFFHMLAGQAPYSKGTLPERIVSHMQNPVPDLREHNKHVPKSFVAIIGKMLEKKPADRYQTPAELLKDLEQPDRIVRASKAEVKKPRGNEGTAEFDKVEPPKKPNTDASVEVEVQPIKVASDKPKKRRTDPELKTQPEPAAATKMHVETAEFEQPRPDKARKKSAQNPPWGMYAVGGSAALLACVLIFAIVSSSRRQPEEKKDKSNNVAVQPSPVELPTPDPIDTSANKMTVPSPDLQFLDKAIANIDRADLRKEFFGPFGVFPDVPQGARTMRVARLAPTAPGSYRTIAEAISQTAPDQWTLIEIADNGPIYVPALPPLAKRLIVLRGAAGYHPLIAWDLPKKPTGAKEPLTLMSLAHGSILLDNLDVVVKSSEDVPATVFDLDDSDFFARNCTFSLLGRPSRETTLLKRRSSDPAGPKRVAQTWLKRCYVRGAQLSLLSLAEASANLLLEESLIAGQHQPLIQMRGGDDDALGLYCIRSTVVCGQVFLRWQPPEGKRASPRVQGRALDSILSRDDPKAALGDLLQFSSEFDGKNLSWRAINTIYAGWKRLLSANDKNIAGNEIEAWREQFKYAGPDHALADCWPAGPPSTLEMQPASTFLPSDPVSYAAISSHGALGAAIGLLPGQPVAWIERAYEPQKTPSLPLDGPLPVIEPKDDGLYHGEYLDLNQVDLGKYLNDKLARGNPAPRVVLYLTGKGTRPTSPLRIEKVEHLVLYFVPTKDPKDALTLTLDASSIATRLPLIEMTGGRLELIGARVHLSNLTLMPHVLKLRDASLTLKDCRLDGPFVKATDAPRSLITMSNPDEPPATLLVRNSLLASSKTLVHLAGNVQIKAINSVFLSFSDAVQIDADGPIGALTHLFDHNTFAARHAIVSLRPGKEFEAVGNVRLFATSNAFLRPFSDEWDKGALLRGAESWTASGRWHWQGRNNVYDARLFAYYAPADKLAPGRQMLQDWQIAWGAACEQESLLYEGAPANKAITLDAATQFDKLVLPPQLRGDPTQAPPGADLVGLRLAKKKG